MAGGEIVAPLHEGADGGGRGVEVRDAVARDEVPEAIAHRLDEVSDGAHVHQASRLCVALAVLSRGDDEVPREAQRPFEVAPVEGHDPPRPEQLQRRLHVGRATITDGGEGRRRRLRAPRLREHLRGEGGCLHLRGGELEGPRDGGGLPQILERLFEAPAGAPQARPRDQGAGPIPVSLGTGGEGDVEDVAAELEGADPGEERREAGSALQRQIGPREVTGAREDRLRHVVDLTHAHHLASAEVLGVPAPRPGRRGRVGDSLARVLADPLEHAVGGAIVVVDGRGDQRVVSQRLEGRESVAFVLGPHDRGRGREIEGARDDGARGERVALALAEHRPGLVEGGAQAPVRRSLPGRIGGEQLQPAIELLRELLGREHAEARRGELDRERQAVELADDGLDDRRGERPSIAGAPRPLFEESRRRRGRPLAAKHRERLDLDHALERQAEPGAGGDQEARLGGDPREERDADPHLLARDLRVVAEDHRRAEPAQRSGEHVVVVGGRPRAQGDAEGVGEAGPDRLRAARRGQIDEDHRAGVEAARERLGEARLAHAGRAEEGDERRASRERGANGLEIGFTPDHADGRAGREEAALHAESQARFLGRREA